ncbi:MAG: hypothetical protein Q7R33_05190 [Nitrosarchaeum sp.]|nr:hypothetical protein [Nitrosarchaeum sp.]
MKNAHSLINRVIDENGVTDKYGEFDNIDFSNSFEPLEHSDYEIRASQRTNKLKEDVMKGTRKDASYVGELSSGFDASVQDDYQAGKGDKGQAGKGHEEAVAEKNNWGADKRDAVGRAASSLLRRTAARLNKMAELMDKEEELTPEETDQLEEIEMDTDVNDDDAFEDVDKEAASKEAAHPIEHDQKKDDPEANASSQEGDDEWVDIGPGTFDDKRDEVGRAA